MKGIAFSASLIVVSLVLMSDSVYAVPHLTSLKCNIEGVIQGYNSKDEDPQCKGEDTCDIGYTLGIKLSAVESVSEYEESSGNTCENLLPLYEYNNFFLEKGKVREGEQFDIPMIIRGQVSFSNSTWAFDSYKLKFPINLREPLPTPKCYIKGTIRMTLPQKAYEAPCLTKEYEKCSGGKQAWHAGYSIGIDIDSVEHVSGETEHITCENLLINPYTSIVNDIHLHYAWAWSIFLQETIKKPGDVFVTGQKIEGLVSFSINASDDPSELEPPISCNEASFQYPEQPAFITPLTAKFDEYLLKPPVPVIFSDVPVNHPAAEAINFLKTTDSTGVKMEEGQVLSPEGPIGGYPDGTFRPDDTINRAEFLKIVIEALIPSATNPSFKKKLNCFPDVRGTWFENYVCLAAGEYYDLIKGYPDGTFKPERTINFAEAAKILSLASGSKHSETPIWYQGYIDLLAKNGITPITIKSIDQELTRGEMAQMIYRLKIVLRNSIKISTIMPCKDSDDCC